MAKTKATIENMKKLAGTPGIVMFSPTTGETFSATVGDYFWAPPKHVFKDSQGRVMYLGTQVPQHARPILENPRWTGDRYPFGPRSRMFDGKRYYLTYADTSSYGAHAHAGNERGAGHKARVTQDVYGMFLVWVRRAEHLSGNPKRRNQMQSVFGITPITPKAKKWIKANVQADPWQWLGPTLVVEYRYIADLVAGMLEAGMITNKDFRVG